MPRTLDFIPEPHEVISGPRDVGSEQRWVIRLGDGRRAVAGRLSPELARDESIMRRYVGDIRRVTSLETHVIAPILSTGPDPEHAAAEAGPPWRVRADPEGES